MKNFKIAVAAVAFLFVTNLSFGQGSLGKGNAQLNAGFGLSGWGVPVYVGLDFGVHPDITVGGEASFASYNESYYSNHYTHTIIGLVGNGNYHFNRILNMRPEWDFYAGASLGVYIWSSPSDYDGDHSTGLVPNLQVGGRYFFNDNFGLNLELGGGSVSGGKFGITYKF